MSSARGSTRSPSKNNGSSTREAIMGLCLLLEYAVLFLAVLVMVKGFHVSHIYGACILSYSAFLCHIQGLS